MPVELNPIQTAFAEALTDCARRFSLAITRNRDVDQRRVTYGLQQEIRSLVSYYDAARTRAIEQLEERLKTALMNSMPVMPLNMSPLPYCPNCEPHLAGIFSPLLCCACTDKLAAEKKGTR